MPEKNFASFDIGNALWLLSAAGFGSILKSIGVHLQKIMKRKTVKVSTFVISTAAGVITAIVFAYPTAISFLYISYKIGILPEWYLYNMPLWAFALGGYMSGNVAEVLTKYALRLLMLKIRKVLR